MANRVKLGRNFWLFQTGQMISIIGDTCGNVALAWWILDATGNAGSISQVLVPALLVQTLLTPLFGPLGDRFSRKRLIICADVLRGLMMSLLAFMAIQQHFSLPGVTWAYVLFTVGAALFNSSNMSIVPQLVPVEGLPRAVQMNQSLEAIGRVIGGVLAGGLITWIGAGAALSIDAISFGVSILATASVTLASSTKAAVPQRFVRQLGDGFRAVFNIPVLLWLCIAMAFFTLILSPMQVLLPAYSKQLKQMPAWFLGGLEASMGLGIILGAISVSALDRVPLRGSSLLVGLFLIGAGMAILAHVPGAALPMFTMLVVGIGIAWTNIPLGTRISVAVPDHFRSRVNSIFSVVTDGVAPLGVAAGGIWVSAFGVTYTMTFLGLIALGALPLLFWIPGFMEFFRRPAEKLGDYFSEKEKLAFSEE